MRVKYSVHGSLLNLAFLEGQQGTWNLLSNVSSPRKRGWNGKQSLQRARHCIYSAQSSEQGQVQNNPSMYISASANSVWICIAACHSLWIVELSTLGGE